MLEIPQSSEGRSNLGPFRHLAAFNSNSEKNLTKQTSPDKQIPMILNQAKFDPMSRRESLRIYLQRGINPIQEVPEEQRLSLKKKKRVLKDPS